MVQNTVLVGTAGRVVLSPERSDHCRLANDGTKHTAANCQQMHWKTMAAELGSQHLCCNRTRQFLYLHGCLNFNKCDERHCTEPISSSLVTQTIARRTQAVDHSKQCRSRVEAILVTTTEGHMRLERAKERFAQFIKAPSVGESPAQETLPWVRKGRRPHSATGINSVGVVGLK